MHISKCTFVAVAFFVLFFFSWTHLIAYSSNYCDNSLYTQHYTRYFSKRLFIILFRHSKHRNHTRSNREPTPLPLSTDEESEMWCKLAIIEHKLDQMEEGVKARYYPRKGAHNYHTPVISLGGITSVPHPWPINLFLLGDKDRPGGSDTSSVYEDPAKDECHQMKVTPLFGWRIHNIAGRVQETESSNSPLYSLPFSTGPNGYHMCLEIYLNGDGQDTHVSLYLVMIESRNEHVLKWPFIKPVIFELVNQQDPTKSMSTSFISQIWSPLHRNKKRKDERKDFWASQPAGRTHVCFQLTDLETFAS